MTESGRPVRELLREALDDVRYGGGNGTSDYWRGFNDGIDKVAERLEALTGAPARDEPGIDPEFDAAWKAVTEALRAADQADLWGHKYPNERLSLVLRGNPDRGWDAYFSRDRVAPHESPAAALRALVADEKKKNR